MQFHYIILCSFPDNVLYDLVTVLSLDRSLVQQLVDRAALSMDVHTVLSAEADSNTAVLQSHETKHGCTGR